MKLAKPYRRAVVWMRRALRVQDQMALWHALQNAEEVIPVVCVRDDPRYYDGLPRRSFIHSAIAGLDANLRTCGSFLTVRIGRPEREIPATVAAYRADAVYAIAVYDAPTRDRDATIAASAKEQGAVWHTVKDAVMFEGNEIRNGSGEAYRVFTPYKRAWLARAGEIPPPLRRITSIVTPPPLGASIGWDRIPGVRPGTTPGGENAALRRLKQFTGNAILSYKEDRDFPGIDGTSRLSSHLAHGTISVRRVYRAAKEAASETGKSTRENIDVFIGELIWREFYCQIMSNFPFVVHHAFKGEFEHIPWANNEKRFKAWCSGQTGYPIVDAALRQLNTEGWMHNRARMIVASFLTKDLHIDWRKGERYFQRRNESGIRGKARSGIWRSRRIRIDRGHEPRL